MAKTVFIDGNPALGIIGTIVDAAWLNAVFNHRHDGANADGSAPINYAADTGAANAYIIALTPALTARVVGMPIYFMAANINTGASTINDGLGAATLVRPTGSALLPGDITAGAILAIAWTGAVYQLITAITAGVIRTAAAQAVTAANAAMTYVATGAFVATHAQSTTLNTNRTNIFLAVDGAITITPYATDSINGGAAGASVVIPLGGIAIVSTDGAGNLFVASAGSASGGLLNIQIFTTIGTSTYTPTLGVKSAVAKVQAAGGAAGGAPATGSGQNSAGGGGGAGGYAEKRILNPTSQTVTLGAGIGVSGGTGGNGASSSFGAIVSATGGVGGSVIGPAASPFFIHGGAGGTGSGGDLNITGQTGPFSSVSNGYGVPSAANAEGQFGSTYGSGGTPNANTPSSAALTGANGLPPIAIVCEYA